MKKIIGVMLTLVMGLSLLTGCGSDPVADEFETFLNTDMVQVNANYEDLKTEVGTWDSLSDDAAFASSISDVILPNLDESLELLSEIEVTTDEVKAVKDKYQDVLEAYKEGYELMLAALEAGDEDALDTALEKVDEGIELLEVYNNALEELAQQTGMEIQY